MNTYRVLLDSRYSVEEIYERTKNEEYNTGTWIECRNIAEFSKLITNNQLENDIMPDMISLEFNLGFDIQDKTINRNAESGPDAIRWLIMFCESRRQKLPDYLVHAENENQARDLRVLLRNAKDYYNL